jgi:DNA-binding XRE family transcriptional regulator
MVKVSLKAARINANLNQKAAAAKLGISNKTLCNWENGKTEIPVSKVESICDLYNLHYDEINFLPERSL